MMGLFSRSKKNTDVELVQEITNMSSFLNEKNLQTTKDLKSLLKYFDKCPFIYTLLDQDLIIKKHNYTLKKVLNFPNSQITDNCLMRDIHPDDVNDFKQFIKLIKKGDKSIVSRLVSKHGDLYTIKWYGIYIEDENLYLLFGQDITNEVKLNDQVRDTIKYKNIVLDNYPGSIVCTNKYGKIVEFNKQASRLSGFTKGDILKNHIYELFPKKDLFCESNLNTIQKVYLNRKDKRKLQVYLSLNPMYENNQLVGYIGVFHGKKYAEIIKEALN